jgi:hypothetical protein
MTLTHQDARSRATHDNGRFVRHPEPRRWIERLSRLGLVVRGFIYFVPGVFALQWALGQPRQSMTQTSAIELVAHQPLGRALLVVVAIGLAGYAAWGGFRAFSDAQHRGHSPTGIAMRFGYAMSAVAYLGLLLATLRLLAGTPSQAAKQADWSLALLARPFGGVVVVVVGLCWIFGSGIAQIVTGWRHSFDHDLVLERMGRAERDWAIGLGRVGLVSRGLVFTLVGVLLVAAALHLQQGQKAGLEGALTEIARQPFGRALLGTAGLGLMTFGTYSAMCARWMRMHRASRDPDVYPLHPQAS